MENGSNVSDMLHDEINIMFTDWSVTKDMMVIQGTHSSSYFFNCMIIFFYILIYCITNLYISTYPN